MKKIGSNGYVLGSSRCLLEGGFDRPDTILLDLRSAVPVRHGVLEICSKRLSGRIGVVENRTITGAIVDGTGETGVGAVYKLLLIPGGRYLFRFPLKTETWELNQDLSLESLELEQILCGPSAIGLARPTQNFTSPEIEWEERATHASMYIKDCHRLITALIADRQKTLEVTKRKTAVDEVKRQALEEASKRESEMETTKRKAPRGSAHRQASRDLTKQKTREEVIDESSEKEKRISPAMHMCLLFVLMALGSFLLVPSGSWSRLASFDKDGANDSEKTASRGRAGFILPAASEDLPLRGNERSANSSAQNQAINRSIHSDRGSDEVRTFAKESEAPAPPSEWSGSGDSSSSRNSALQPPGPPSQSRSAGAQPINETNVPAYYASSGDASISGVAPPAEEIDSPPATAKSNNITDGEAYGRAAGAGAGVVGGGAGAGAGVGAAISGQTQIEQNVSFWVKRVRLNPNDPVARKYLAYALLYSGNPQDSVRQFRALMSIRNLDVIEEQSYREALALCMVPLR